MRKQFDIKYRPQIESGEYKVETRDGRKARIIHWDLNCTSPIVAVMDAHIDLPGEIVDVFSVSGRAFDDLESPSDLFIVTPEEELTEWQRFISACLQKYGLLDCGAADRIAKESAAELLALAREQFIKDGYVIEKKAFHDAVEKVAPEVMKEVSANIDFENLIHDLSERYPEVSSAKLTSIAKVAYQKGKAEALTEFAEKYKQSWFNEGKIAGRFEGLTEDEKYQQGVHDGKEEALKDLPRWKKCAGCEPKPKPSNEWIFSIDSENVTRESAIVHNGYFLPLFDLEKLLGFKED